MKDMAKKKTRWWCVRDGKRKRTPKSSPAVVISKDGEKGINEEVAAQQAQGSSANVEKDTRVEPESEAQRSSSEEDSEATQSESELIPSTLGRGRAQLKKRPSKKQKASDEEDSPYDPEKSKKETKGNSSWNHSKKCQSKEGWWCAFTRKGRKERQTCSKRKDSMC
ncbi:hypothetical protein Hanom_Chr09g00792481 [Helianthus anomalus]